jgi:hypothetical protein
VKWFLVFAVFVLLLALSALRSNVEERRATERALDALEQEIDPT